METSHPFVWVKRDCAVMYLLQLSLYRLLNWDYSNEHSSSTSGPALHSSQRECRSVAQLLGVLRWWQIILATCSHFLLGVEI